MAATFPSCAQRFYLAKRGGRMPVQQAFDASVLAEIEIFYASITKINESIHSNSVDEYPRFFGIVGSSDENGRLNYIQDSGL